MESFVQFIRSSILNKIYRKIKTNYRIKPRHSYLNWRYKARKVGFHLYVFGLSNLPLFLRFFDCILESLRRVLLFFLYFIISILATCGMNTI
jgi:hypothetical protein